MDTKMFIEIPNYKTVDLKNIVCDYNGTIAKDGKLLNGVGELFKKLTKDFKVFVITADTFGSVQKELQGFDIEIIVLKSTHHTVEKKDFLNSIGAQNSIAIGNGNNDSLMLQEANISIALMGDEGCSVKTLKNADIVCKNILDALELIIYPKRLIATLRE
jgi:soluble P-type ATPase